MLLSYVTPETKTRNTKHHLHKMEFLSSVYGEKNSNEEHQPAFTDEDYIRMSKEFTDTAWDLLHSNDKWKLDKRTATGVTVQSRTVAGLGKVFKLEAEVNFSPKKFADEFFFNVESMPKWNPMIQSTKRIKMIGNSTDIVYDVSAPIAKGLISSRDFVYTRYFSSREGCFIIGGGSVQYHDIPVNSKYIRGESGPGIHMLKPIPGFDDRCIFQGILNIRLNGWIPQYLANMGLTDAMYDYIKSIQSYGNELKEQELMNS